MQSISVSELYQIYLQHPQVFTDSRKVVQGGMFFALKGGRFDGNKFAVQSLEQGAAYAVIDDPTLQQHSNCIWVPDVLTMLQDLARHHRRQFDIPVLGITGSNGKTTTKELVSRVIATGFRLHFTPGNFNNHIGVPLTLLSMPLDTTFAVIEMGANHQGEIDQLCKIAEPNCGMITNIGKAHLEGFGGIEGVKKGKSELYRFLAKHKGVVFINRDERFLEDLAAPIEKKIFYNQQSMQGELGITLLATEPFIKFQLEGCQPVDTHLMGGYNFNNILSAISIGLYFQLPPQQIVDAIATYLPQNNRSEIKVIQGASFVLDAYNANPTSVRHALTTFSQLNDQPKWVILGEMLELGEYSQLEHSQILELAESLQFEKIITVGEAFKLENHPPNILHFEDAKDTGAWLSKQSIQDKWILLKGSRGNRLESILSVFE